MEQQEDICRHLAASLARKGRVVLATVIARSGSGPRGPGAMMLIAEDGQIRGTIGGGILEATVLDRAKEVFHAGRPLLLAFTMSDRQASESGMICGGRMEVLVELADGNDPSADIWERVLKARDAGRRSWLIRSIRKSDASDHVETGLGLLDEEQLDPGTLDLSILNVENVKKEALKAEFSLVMPGDIRYFIQPMADVQTVFIFGAGHIGKELAPLCELLGFRTVVIDDRREFANRERFPAAAGIHVPHSFPDVFDELVITSESFIVIVTRGHLHDRNVLSRALRTNAGYIGMIASRRKRDIIYRSLLEEGFSADDLLRVHSPIGIEIGARTPAEIAVSIAAELIAVRAAEEGATKKDPSPCGRE